MAQMIARGDHTLHVWARREATYDNLGSDPFVIADDPADLARTCAVVGICVTTDDDVRQVVFDHGLLGGLRPGSVLALHSTISVSTCEEIASEAAKIGVDVLDAPVSGGGLVAYDRDLTVMVGGDRDAFERARPVFEEFGGPVCHLGPLGAGLRCKLLNNGIYHANRLIGVRAQEMAVQLGLDTDAFADVISHSSGRSYGSDTLFMNGDQVVPHTEKDIRLVEAEIEHQGIHDNELRVLWRAALATARARSASSSDPS
jgi:3-hydroxyisobutyrate dehydrogenase-like beta-hydroxyacid dehydrogenase